MKYKVKAPVEAFSGEVAGVNFVKGEYTGELSTSALAYFRRRGYDVEEAKGRGGAKPPASGQGDGDKGKAPGPGEGGKASGDKQ